MTKYQDIGQVQFVPGIISTYRECLKCREGSMSSPKYVKEATMVTGECLLRTCTVCGYQTKEPCRDAK